MDVYDGITGRYHMYTNIHTLTRLQWQVDNTMRALSVDIRHAGIDVDGLCIET
jgi:hypothetical protein